MNTVTIEVDDASKRLRFSEHLTTGSKYHVTVDGGSDVAGDSGSLVLLSPRGRLVAYAELTNGEGELSTNTDEMGRMLKNEPVGGVYTLSAVLHASDAGAAQNVAVGIVQIVSAGGAWTDDTTGALNLYRGPAGADSHVRSVVYDGEDADGNYVYRMTFSDGTAHTFKAPHGPRGYDALMTYLKEDGQEKYHQCLLVREPMTDKWVLAVNQTGVTVDLTFDEATIAANGAAQNAQWYALGKFDAEEVLKEKGAKQYADEAAESADAAADDAQSAETAATSAAGSKDAAAASATAAAASATAAAGSAVDADCNATAAAGSATAAAASATAAENAKADALLAIADAVGSDEDGERSGALGAIADAVDAALGSADAEPDENGVRPGALGAIADAVDAALGTSGTEDEDPSGALGEIENARSSAIESILGFSSGRFVGVFVPTITKSEENKEFSLGGDFAGADVKAVVIAYNSQGSSYNLTIDNGTPVNCGARMFAARSYNKTADENGKIGFTMKSSNETYLKTALILVFTSAE